MTDSAKIIRLEPEIQRHVRARLARLPPGAHALNTAGKKLLVEALEHFFDAADDALFALADTATSNFDQNLYFDSMREVRVHRRAVETRFINTVEEAFARLVAADERDFLKDNGELSAEALSLVQNEDLEQMVAIETIVGKANKAFDPYLVTLCSALSSVVSNPVDHKTLPFGPHVLCTAMLAQVKRLDIGIKAKLLLVEVFDQVIIQRLNVCYKQLLEVLKAHSVPITPIASDPQSPDRDSPQSESEDAPGAVSSPSGPKSLLDLLSFVQRLPVSCTSEGSLDIEELLQSIQAKSGEKLEITRVERETIRLVRMMFQLISRTHSLAPPLQELVCRLHVPVLRVALSDPAFLQSGQENHPARRLLNEFVAVATQWGQVQQVSEDDALLRVMRATVEKIQAKTDVNAEVFHRALVDFTSYLESEHRRTAMHEKRTLDAEDGKARAELLRQHVAEEIAQRAPRDLPVVVRDLINGPWSNVLFVTGLKYGSTSAEWQEQLNVMMELVWSVQEPQDKRERQRLIRLIPDLLQRLRRGLEAVSYNPFEVSELFAGLEEIHLLRIRGERRAPPAPPIEPSLNAETQEIAPVEMEEVEVPAELEPEPQSTQSMPEEDPYMRVVANFSQGGWFDLNYGSSAAVRCRLAAFIKQTGKYIFVDRSGSKVAEKTRQELALDLKEGRLRSIDNSMLFDKALESVVSSMRKRPGGPPIDLE